MLKKEQLLKQMFPSIKRFHINSERQTLRGLKVPIISIENIMRSTMVSSDSKQQNVPRSLRHHLSARTSENCAEKEKKMVIDDAFVEDITEWIGAMHCRIRNYVEGAEIDPDMSLMTPNALERAVMYGLVFTHQGFMIPNWVLQQIRQAKSVVDAGMAPYAVLTAWPFVDHPLRQHVHHLNDSFYTIIILEGNHYLLIRPKLN